MNKVLKRVNRKGCCEHGRKYHERIKKANPVQEIAGIRSLSMNIFKELKLKTFISYTGNRVARKKTVKSFMDTFRKGTYLVFVSNHVFTVKDGVLVDNAGEEFRPTRKVIDAVKVTVKENEAQLDFLKELAA